MVSQDLRSNRLVQGTLLPLCLYWTLRSLFTDVRGCKSRFRDADRRPLKVENVQNNFASAQLNFPGTKVIRS